MKKYKLIINILLVAIFVSSIVAWGLLCDTTNDRWQVFNEVNSIIPNNPQYQSYLSVTLCLTFSIIFSVLSTIASAATFIFLNFKVWKEKSNNFNTNS